MEHRLLMLVGTSPAVVTETVYKLCLENDVPAEVIVVTTETGREELKRQLLESGVWKTMLEDLGLVGKIKFGDNSRNILCLPDASRENNLRDVIVTRDNDEAADFLLSVVRAHTEEPNVRISFSISGGRKTMSVLGALVMSLLGRREDKLFHILVSPPFDDQRLSPKFYYPRHGIIHTLGSAQYHSEDAILQLSEIPFVRCRYWFQEKFAGISAYSTLIKNINGADTEISINVRLRELRINGTSIPLSYLEFLLYWMFAERYVGSVGNSYLIPQNERRKLPDIFKAFLKHKGIKCAAGSLGKGNVSRETVFTNQLTAQNLSKRISGIKTKIAETMPELSETEIHFLGLINGTHKLGISELISPENIHIKES